MDYRFHASAPPGEWVNDPNALFFADGRYHLYLQHAADAPDFRRIGWGHLSSPDLMDWRWDGVVVPPDETASIYSGSLVMADPPELFFTRHEREGPWQTQRRALLRPDLASVEVVQETIGPAGRNVRDPFAWRRPDGGQRMLVARPCDWAEWRQDPPSTLELWGSPDRNRWEPLAPIGPWMPPGVMWEVPALIDLGSAHVLLLSTVDRRQDVAECGTRYWLGWLDDNGFTPSADFPPDGVPLDHGPDFYAAIPNVAAGWPGPGRVIIGWASNWRTARAIAWPAARGGGPTAMPRSVTLDGDRLSLSPVIQRRPDFILALADDSGIELARDRAALVLLTHDDRLAVSRTIPGLEPFQHRAPLPRGEDRLLAFVDGPLVELFWRGVTITAVLPGDGPIHFSTTVSVAGMVQTRSPT